jgi:crotonobetainyl-CoA:carnitine CoA-transferase CaiB-like acyl-CoA transferase
MPGMPLRFSEYANDLDLQAPYLGEHNRETLKDLLAYSDDQIDQLERDGAIKAETIPDAAAG